MKTAEIKDILKNNLLIVELPENGYYEVFKHGIYFKDHLNADIGFIEGSYALLGKPDEIKEEYVVDLVEKIGKCKFTWKSYNTEGYAYATALESFNSALEKEILWENPHGKEEPNKSYFLDDKGSFLRQEKKQWHKAQEKTFDKKRTLIFFKN